MRVHRKREGREKNENPWNKLAGYEVLLTQRRRDAEVFVATLKLADGTVKRVEGKAGDGVTLSVDGQTAHNVVEYCPKGVNR